MCNFCIFPWAYDDGRCERVCRYEGGVSPWSLAPESILSICKIRKAVKLYQINLYGFPFIVFELQFSLIQRMGATS